VFPVGRSAAFPRDVSRPFYPVLPRTTGHVFVLPVKSHVQHLDLWQEIVPAGSVRVGINASREGAVNQDVSETRFPPIDAQGFAVKYILCRRAFDQ